MSNTDLVTRWFPRRSRARAMALFILAIPLSSVAGLYAIGWIKGSIESFELGLAALCVLTGSLTLLQGHPAHV